MAIKRTDIADDPASGLAEREALETRPDVATLAAALRSAGERAFGALAGNGLVFVQRHEERRLSYPELWQRSLRAAAVLRTRGVKRGDRVMLMAPLSESYVATVCGAILLGAVPCTVASPSIGQDRLNIWRLLDHAIDAVEPALLVASREFKDLVSHDGNAAVRIAGNRVVTLAELHDVEQDPLPVAELPTLAPDDPLHIQLTSGSTRRSKAVLLSHANVINNVQGISSGLGLVPATDPILSWLPFYHDMGFVQLLLAIYYQTTLVLMPSSAFMRDPFSWLRNIARYRAAHSAAPTFAYSLCVQRFAPDKLDGIDLSSWRRAVVSAEPIPLRILQRFRETFAPYGLREGALCPCYGMAETVLGSTMPLEQASSRRLFGLVSVDLVDAERLRREDRAWPLPAGGVDQAGARSPVLEVVGVGRALRGLEISVRGLDGAALPDRAVGEICVRGSSLMRGYRDEAESVAAVRDGWYRTGDRGYLVDGELFVLGRLKNLIIVRGRNFDPHDVEMLVEACPSVRLDSSVAFGRFNLESGTDDVIIVVESKAEGAARAAVRTEVQAALQQAFGFVARDIVVVRHGTLPRTTSHKKQHGLVAQWYAEGRFFGAVGGEVAETAAAGDQCV